MKNKIAFTLVELLITLSVIGIVAALTLPIITKKISHMILKSQFNKTYLELCELAKNVYIKEDMSLPEYNISLGLPYSWGLNTHSKEIFSHSSHKIEVLKKNSNWCGTLKDYTILGKDISGCDVHVCSNMSIGVYHDLTSNRYYALGGIYQNSTNVPICVDTNGDKKPNRYGYDRFIFLFVNDNSVKPYSNSESQCSKLPYRGREFNSCAAFALINKNPDGNGDYWNDFLP